MDSERPFTVLPCPGCGRRNRVPAERLGQLAGVQCAACGAALGPLLRP